MKHIVLSTVIKEPGRTEDYPPLWIFAMIFDEAFKSWGGMYHVLNDYNQTEAAAIRLLLSTQLIKKFARGDDEYDIFVMSDGEKMAYEKAPARLKEDNWVLESGNPIPNAELWKKIAEARPVAKIGFVDTFGLNPEGVQALSKMNRGAEAFIATENNRFAKFTRAKVNQGTNITIEGYQKDTGTLEKAPRKGAERVCELVVRSLKKDGKDLAQDKTNWFDLLAAVDLAEEILKSSKND